jgi:hypothetical protein
MLGPRRKFLPWLRTRRLPASRKTIVKDIAKRDGLGCGKRPWPQKTRVNDRCPIKTAGRMSRSPRCPDWSSVRAVSYRRKSSSSGKFAIIGRRTWSARRGEVLAQAGICVSFQRVTGRKCSLWKNRKKLFLRVDNPISVPYTHQVLRNATLLDRGGYRS